MQECRDSCDRVRPPQQPTDYESGEEGCSQLAPGTCFSCCCNHTNSAFLLADGVESHALQCITAVCAMQDPEVARIADKHGKTVAQTLLRWGLQHGTSVIPKSTNPKHSQVRLCCSMAHVSTLGLAHVQYGRVSPWCPLSSCGCSIVKTLPLNIFCMSDIL